MNKEEIISGMELIMHIASFYAHPSASDVADMTFYKLEITKVEKWIAFIF